MMSALIDNLETGMTKIVPPVKNLGGQCTDALLQQNLLKNLRLVLSNVSTLKMSSMVLYTLAPYEVDCAHTLLAYIRECFTNVSELLALSSKSGMPQGPVNEAVHPVLQMCSQLERWVYVVAVGKEMAKRYPDAIKKLLELKTTTENAMRKDSKGDNKGEVLDLVTKATNLAKHISVLVAKIKVDASNMPIAGQKKAEWAAKELTNETGELVSRAKEVIMGGNTKTAKVRLQCVMDAMTGIVSSS